MVSNSAVAEVAALIGDQARAAMLDALMDGRALTAAELAYVAGVTPQTASGHLARMTEAGLLSMEKQGRHRYHRLASPAVAQTLEGLRQLAAAKQPARRTVATGPRDAAMRRARTCYDHLAGQIAVAVADSLIEKGRLELTSDGGALTDSGATFLAGLGVALLPGPSSKRPFCRPCLDWSERRLHLAGVVGGALCSRAFDLGWVRRRNDGRALDITRAGEVGFREAFGVTFE